jgi:uncharacterized membrane protein/protein-disulfide isomerase
MTPRLRWFILAVAVAGLGVAGASTWVHYRLLTDPTYISPCDVGAAFNCTQVYLSRYGSVAGVPVAVTGLAWFGLVALIAAFARADARPSVAAAYLTTLGTVGLAVSLYLAYVSWFVLETGCLLCMATYACVLAILVGASRASAVPIASLSGRLGADVSGLRARPAAAGAAILLAGTVAVLVATFPREGAMAAAAETTAGDATPAAATGTVSRDHPFAAWWFQHPRVDLGITAEGAQVIVVKFNDFACGACAQAHYLYDPVLDRFEKSHPGAVRLVVKDWPWDTSCNFNAGSTIPGHEGACAAAAAARMAEDRGQYDEMASWLYQNHAGTVQEVRAAAAKLLGVTDFDREYALKLPEIRRDIADGGALGVGSTPTYFINGVRLMQMLQPAQFEMAIRLELESQASN